MEKYLAMVKLTFFTITTLFNYNCFAYCRDVEVPIPIQLKIQTCIVSE